MLYGKKKKDMLKAPYSFVTGYAEHGKAFYFCMLFAPAKQAR